MVKILHGLGIKSEIAYGAALFSIAASIGAWATSRSKEEAPAAKAERWGIFVGLWAPTFMGLGNALKVEEK